MLTCQCSQDPAARFACLRGACGAVGEVDEPGAEASEARPEAALEAHSRCHWWAKAEIGMASPELENVVQWALAVRIGGHTVAGGFRDAFEYFTILGYLFFTAFRLVPYVGLGIILVVLSKTKLKDYVLPVFVGGLVGILAMILWGAWMVQRPYYTDEHVSSTMAIAFLFIPVYAVPAGAIGAILFGGLYTPIRYVMRKTEPTDSLDST